MTAKILTATKDLSYEEWLDYRKQGIGGSDASVVCGLNRYKSPVQLWMEKTGRMPDQQAGETAYWGTVLEPVVRSEFTTRTGIDVAEHPFILQSDTHPFMIANLDGICENTEHGTCIFEAKTASAYKAAEWMDSIPDAYQLQAQHYMAVTGCTGVYVAVLIGGNTFKWVFLERDDELISMIVRLEEHFWEHVQKDTTPPIDGTEASAKLLAEKFNTCTPNTSIALPPEAADILHSYDEVCEQLDRLTEEKRKAENQLKEMLGENEIGTIDDRTVSWKSVSQERLDSKTLKAEHPTLYKKYANQTSYRRFTVKTAS